MSNTYWTPGDVDKGVKIYVCFAVLDLPRVDDYAF